jgi:hypothetical protein
MARFEKQSDEIQKWVTGILRRGKCSTVKFYVSRIFYYKTFKIEEIMMGQFNDWFVYLWNSGKVPKYGIGKRSGRLLLGSED